MSRMDKFISWFLAAGFLVIILIVVYLGIKGTGALEQAHPVLNKATGIFVMIWMLGAVYFVLRLVFSSVFRDSILARAMSMRERDEMEELLAARSARSVLLSLLAVLMLLFGLSILHVNVEKIPPDKAVKGREKTLSIGLGFEIFEKKPAAVSSTAENRTVFAYNGLPVSKSSLILFIILWSFASYRISLKLISKKMEGDK